jgi:hypothetical protein
MPKVADWPITGGSGKKYDFEVYAWGTAFKSIGAVYVVSKRDVDTTGKGTHEIIYIGQSGDLSERFDGHHKAQCFRNHNANCISIHLEGSEDARFTIEADLLAANPRTPCND